MQLNEKEIAAQFDELHSRLRELETRCNPGKENLHFVPAIQVDAALFPALLALAQQGVARVRELSWHFSEHPLYDDGMFWYNLFLLVSNAGVQAWRDGLAPDVSSDTARQIVEALVDISEFSSVHRGDIVKRNHEALGNIMYGLYSPQLSDVARRRAETSGNPKVADFVARTIARVEEVRGNSRPKA